MTGIPRRKTEEKEHESEMKGESEENCRKKRKPRRKIQKTQATERNTHVTLSEKGTRRTRPGKKKRTPIFFNARQRMQHF